MKLAPIAAPNTDDPRQLKGLQIAALSPIKKHKYGYKVQSQSGNGWYLVNLDDVYCECLDFEAREKACKHVYGVQFRLQREQLEDGTEVYTPQYRMWSNYNKAQVSEGEMFKDLLRELCDMVPQPPQTGPGRPKLPVADVLYSMALKVYSQRSSRRAQSDISEAVKDGQVEVAPAWGTLIRYFENADMTPILEQLIHQSALPLRDIEQDFAVDASGLASNVYDRWFDHKWGRAKKEAKWVKLHIMCGVKTNIITAAEVTGEFSADSPHLPGLLETTKRNFNIREVSGDMAYSSKRNLHAIDDAGATPYIPFKKSSNVDKKDALWTQMYHYFTLQEVEFNKHYHKRSNVETCFHMIKSKFGHAVKSKTPTAQINEALVKVLCHNICVLIQAMHTIALNPDFSKN